MTNGDWIRSLTDGELEEKVLNACSNFNCGECPMRNARGKCVTETDRTTVLEWLESEREK